jgi:hypothetical protein
LQEGREHTLPVAVGTDHREGLSKQEDLPKASIKTTIDDGMFPSRWRAPDVDVRATTPSQDAAAMGVAAIRDATSLYPPQLLSELEHVYLVGELSFSGILAGGTNSANCLYLATSIGGRRRSTEEIKAAFHHEFSSILMRRHPSRLLEADWTACNTGRFAYLGNGVLASKQNRASMTIDPRLFESGFLCQYAQSSMENDFNCVAQELFLGSQRLWAASRDFDRIRCKVDRTIAFYESLCQAMDRTYFESLKSSVLEPIP